MAGKGDMSVRQAGQKGGRKTAETHDSSHYQNIGKKGGDRVSELVDRGKRSEDKS